MNMPGRSYNAGNQYRYGFNGKENDKDISEGVQDYGMRIYDSRSGKFLSVDPLASKYPFYTPYQFAGNMPIRFIDLDGKEPAEPGKNVGDKRTGTNGSSDVASTWEWNGKQWIMSTESEVVVKSGYKNNPNFHKPITPAVRRLYDNEKFDHAISMVADLAESMTTGLFKDWGFKKSLDKIIYNSMNKDNKKLYNAYKNVSDNKDNPVKLAVGGIATILSATGLNWAYDNILVGIMLNDFIRETNITYFSSIDKNWANTLAIEYSIFFNPNCIASSNNYKPALKNDYIALIAVSQRQLVEIMNNKFFDPAKYQVVGCPVNGWGDAKLSNGESPNFYIYFNKLFDKGFLHISEIGVAPIYLDKQ